ncbi:hypothetical protein GCM10009504_05630 [Pseudomonas laurentiana]|uniref:hypothetical protein n=1 Tax=Pseudomonas laurentiana TaxID=2364649 RepID=UPI001673FDBF|nr:hypothetical protein [Pseudomonas laurentiana]GGU51775.1 hypothetical protein GCM10009504_05630 [Pseudomonas laurentiana]
MRVNLSMVGLYLAIIGSSMFYTLFVMWGVTEVIELEGGAYWVVAGVVFLFIAACGLRFYVPKLRDLW